jgi:sugar phosphate isomerase/epimerase
MTSDFHGESRNTGEIRETLAKIARAGFSHVHWCHEWSGTYLYSSAEMLQIREWCGELGLRVKGVHATEGVRRKSFDPADGRDLSAEDTKHYVSLNEYNRLAGVELVKNRVDLAHILGAEALVLHLGQPWQAFERDRDYRDAFYRQAFKSLDELEPYCRIRQIRICIENLPEPPEAHGIRQFDALFERYGAEYLGLCFDAGHAAITCKENPLAYAERYRDRLFMVHLHDNQGQHDEHLLPFEGVFPWEAFTRVLARSPYEFPLLLESSTRQAGDDSAWLDQALQRGSRLHRMTRDIRGPANNSA